jgi:hypothetical protein
VYQPRGLGIGLHTSSDDESDGSWSDWQDVDAWCDEVDHSLRLTDAVPEPEVGARSTSGKNEECEFKDPISKISARKQRNAAQWDRTLRKVTDWIPVPSPDIVSLDTAAAELAKTRSVSSLPPSVTCAPSAPPAFVPNPSPLPQEAPAFVFLEPVGVDVELFYFAVLASCFLPRDADRARELKMRCESWINQQRPDWTLREVVRQIAIVLPAVWKTNDLNRVFSSECQSSYQSIEDEHELATRGLLKRSLVDRFFRSITPSFWKERTLPPS